jgi:uncharacterized protein (DUF2147 family)
MKKLVLAGLFALSATIANADPLEGIWKTEVDDGNYGHIKISACGPAFCGIIHKSFNATGEFVSENKGKKLVIDMMPQGEGEYEGSVWRPSNDKIYYGTISLAGDKLELAGCVAGGLICSRQSWTREK